jgi:hypothetical protein
LFGDDTATFKLLNIALAAAHNANDESIVLRDLGQYEIMTASTQQAQEEGELRLEQALNLDKKYDLPGSSYIANFLKVTAEFAWADSIASYDCKRAQEHFSSGVNYLNNSVRTLEMDGYRKRARNEFNVGIGTVLTCKPTNAETDIE